MAKFNWYIFQQSTIWGAPGEVDPDGEVLLISSKSEKRARKNLPAPGMGRSWVLTDTEPK